jgi:hypothetical protein
LEAAVRASAPRPSAEALGAWLDGDLRAPPGARPPPRGVLAYAYANARPVEVTHSGIERWKVLQVAWYGALRARYEGDAVELAPSSEEAERGARACWSALFEGRGWDVMRSWEERYLPPAMSVFAALLAARQVPPAVRQRTLRDLREAFYLHLQMGQPPLWTDLAARVVMNSGADLAAVIGDDGRATLLRCATRRGRWADTVARLWPDATRDDRRVAVVERCAAPLHAWVDAHLLMRLVAAWEEDPNGDPWKRITHNRGRTWARVRALAADRHRDALARVLLAQRALHARTVAAVRQLAWSWAWRELGASFSFSFDDDRGGPARCVPVEVSVPPLSAEARAALRTWVLLCLLRGRGDHLRRWVRDGTTGDRDSAWGRLLAHDLPAERRSEGLAPLRERLADDLADAIESWASTLDAIGAVPVDRRLPERVRSILEPSWSRDVPLPRGGYPAIRENARRERRDGGLP